MGVQIGGNSGPEIKFGGGGKDPIGESLKVRKSQPGESITNTSPKKEKSVKEEVFKLKLIGEGANILTK